MTPLLQQHSGVRNGAFDEKGHGSATERIAAANGRRRYSLFNGDVGTALFAAACLDAHPRFPIVDVMENQPTGDSLSTP